MSSHRAQRVPRDGRRSARTFIAIAAAVAALAMPAAFVAAPSAHAAALETPMLDPWVPPALRKSAPAPAASGEALKAQVERELRAAFDAADTDRAGALTRDQARAAGLGYIVKNFDAMDESGSGRVRFDDVKRYLRARGANL